MGKNYNFRVLDETESQIEELKKRLSPDDVADLFKQVVNEAYKSLFLDEKSIEVKVSVPGEEDRSVVLSNGDTIQFFPSSTTKVVLKSSEGRSVEV